MNTPRFTSKWPHYFGQLMETWKDQAYLEPGSGSTPACFKNNTLQYSLDNGQVITIILDRLFPDTGFNIQVSFKALSWCYINESLTMMLDFSLWWRFQLSLPSLQLAHHFWIEPFILEACSESWPLMWIMLKLVTFHILLEDMKVL